MNTSRLCLLELFKLNNNLDLFNVKDIFREAGKQGLIDQVESWFESLEARNLTSHTYDETIADVRKKIKYDILYIKKVCLWTDFIICLRTVRVVLTGAGAR